MSRLQVSVIQMCSSVQTSVCVKHFQWKSPLILMYAVIKDMYGVYMMYTHNVRIICLFVHCSALSNSRVQVCPTWLIVSDALALLLSEHYRSTTPCSMPILNNTVLKKYFSIYWCVLLRSNSMSTIGVLLRAQWALLSVLCVTTQCQFHTTFLYIIVRFSMSTTRCQF